jgi:PAS domain S-box-containing protein
VSNDLAFDWDERAMRAIGSFVDDGFCLCEMIVDDAGRPLDYRFLDINRHFEAMTGLADAKGRTALELVPNLERHWIETYGRVALAREPLRFESDSDAMGRTFDVFAAPAEGKHRFAIVFRDITRLKRAEAEREAALVEARQLLLELNHRVMNSLGVISSIIAMEARDRPDGDGRQALNRVGTRVQAVARLYQELTRSDGIDAVDAAAYLDRVLTALVDSIGCGESVRLTWEIAPVRLTTEKAVPLALIVNELVTNCLKYAFPDDAGGSVAVILSAEGERHALSIADDGQGMAQSSLEDGGLGQRLVSGFVQRIEGELELTTGRTGTRITIRFPAD